MLRHSEQAQAAAALEQGRPLADQAATEVHPTGSDPKSRAVTRPPQGATDILYTTSEVPSAKSDYCTMLYVPYLQGHDKRAPDGLMQLGRMRTCAAFKVCLVSRYYHRIREHPSCIHAA